MNLFRQLATITEKREEEVYLEELNRLLVLVSLTRRICPCKADYLDWGLAGKASRLKWVEEGEQAVN